MSVQVFCPKCDRSCRIKQEYLGKRVRCPGCQEIFKAEEVPVAEPDDLGTEVLPEFTPSIPFPKAPDVVDHPRRPKEEDSDRPRRSRDDEDDRPRRPKDEEAPSKKPRKDAPSVQVGKVENPFDERSTLAQSAAPVDSSLFDFDYADVPPPKKKKEDEDDKPVRRRRDEDDDERPRRTRRDADDDADNDDSDLEDRSRKRKPGETLPAWGHKVPPDHLPKEPPLVKKAARPAEPQTGSPFEFGEDSPPKPVAKRPPPTPETDDDEEPDERPARHSEQSRKAPINDDADFLGLRNMDDEPSTPAPEKPKARKKGGRRYFHARQSGVLFRVFIELDELAFVTAAVGKDVAAVEAALASDSVEDLDRRLRNKLADLDELSIDELTDGDRNGFRFSAGKIISAAVDPAGRKLLRKTGAATLLVEHKSKGKLSFDLPDQEDARRAIDFLPDLIDEVFEVNVRWDKNKECFVAR